jgi:chromosome partitioning protein
MQATEIKELRSHLGLSQAAFARKLGGTSAVTVSRWERGETAPTSNYMARLEKLRRSIRPLTLALTMGKGGSGKTLSTLNLGTALARYHQKKVLLVDLDPQASLSKTFLDPEQISRCIYDALIGSVPLEEVIHPTEEQVDLIPSAKALTGLNTNSIEDPDLPFVLRDQLEGLAYDLVLIDTPPNRGQLMYMAMIAADKLILPVKASYYDLEEVDTTVEAYEKIHRRYNPDLSILGFLVTQYSDKVLARNVLGELKSYSGDRVFTTAIRSNVKLEESPAYNRSVFAHDPQSRGARNYRRLAEEVLQWLETT